MLLDDELAHGSGGEYEAWHDEKLDARLQDARRSSIDGMQRFAEAQRHDIEAVRNAVLEPLSNGQTEAQINRLKTLKRTMYGRPALTCFGRTDAATDLGLAPKVQQTSIAAT